MNGKRVDLGIVVALKEELAAVSAALSVLPAERAARIRIVRGGLGGAAAAQATQKLLATAPGLRLLASSGFCGGLKEGLEQGGVFLATGVTARAQAGKDPARAEVIAAHAEALSIASSALRAAGLSFHTGLLVTIVQPVLTSAEKMKLATASGAAAVDMEAAAVARVALSRGAGFLSLRAVTDGVKDELPPEVGEFLDESGKVRPTKVLRYAAGGTTHLRKLWELKSRSERASAALTAAWEAVLPELLAWMER
jgi:adenosylhomocysteine nucleosidase